MMGAASLYRNVFMLIYSSNLLFLINRHKNDTIFEVVSLSGLYSKST